MLCAISKECAMAPSHVTDWLLPLLFSHLEHATGEEASKTGESDGREKGR